MSSYPIATKANDPMDTSFSGECFNMQSSPFPMPEDSKNSSAKMTGNPSPANAVSRFIKLKHQKAPGGVNANVRVPNQKRAIYQVVVAGDGEEEKEWENRARGEVLEQMYDENSGHLEAEADEDTRVGYRFLEHQDLVKASAGGEDGGRRYKEQLDKIHMVVANWGVGGEYTFQKKNYELVL